MRAGTRLSRRGATLIEILIAATLFTVVIMASLTLVDSSRRFSSSIVEITSVENLAQQMLFKIEHELASAAGFEPTAVLTAGGITAEETLLLSVDSTLGFPPRGDLLLERGTPSEERLHYDVLNADQLTFANLSRGQSCTTPAAHGQQAELLWVGLAEPIEDQTDPAATDYDGVALEEGVPVYFRGDGAGFAYRIPVDPTGGNDYLNGDELTFGAEIRGVGPSLAGRLALFYEPQTEYDEGATGDDLNDDGDTDDVFDVGQVRRLAWLVSDPTKLQEEGLGPATVLQERCNWGGDLDADGFADPLFLWNQDTNVLHLRLFVMGRSTKDAPVVRRVESVIFLRNEPEL